MLVLTRKLHEQIRIGDDITITILRVKGQAVRVGIEAPESVRVLRAELPPKDAGASASVAADGASRGEPGAPLTDDADDLEGARMWLASHGSLGGRRLGRHAPPVQLDHAAVAHAAVAHAL